MTALGHLAYNTIQNVTAFILAICRICFALSTAAAIFSFFLFFAPKLAGSLLSTAVRNIPRRKKGSFDLSFEWVSRSTELCCCSSIAIIIDIFIIDL